MYNKDCRILGSILTGPLQSSIHEGVFLVYSYSGNPNRILHVQGHSDLGGLRV